MVSLLRVGATAAVLVVCLVSGQTCSVQWNVDFVGHDISTSKRSSPFDCCGDCRNTPKCKAYNWFDGICYLKSAQGATIRLFGGVSGVLDKSTAPTTTVPGDGKCSIQLNVDFVGKDIRTTFQADPTYCCADCQATKGCKAYNWFDGVCYLKYEKRHSFPLPGGVSGVLSVVPPTSKPTPAPTAKPTPAPTAKPTPAPTAKPTPAPTAKPTPAPTTAPTLSPTSAPTSAPTHAPTDAPTSAPTSAPTVAPTSAPTSAPTHAPTDAPTSAPTSAPTDAPTSAPTSAPTDAPTDAPTSAPTSAPTDAPTSAPTVAPTTGPTLAPNPSSTVSPTPVPTASVPLAENFYIHHDGYSLLFNCARRTADRWNYTLGKEKGDPTRPSAFYFDPDVSKDCQQKSVQTYPSTASSGTSYDRGHLVASAHMTDSVEQRRQSHYMTNIAPQVASFNRGIWEKTEGIEACHRDLQPLSTWGGLIYTDASNDYFLESHG
ncbi:hypothetical protein DYB32_010303, partial [Aphanomyces invadans]